MESGHGGLTRAWASASTDLMEGKRVTKSRNQPQRLRETKEG